MNEEKLAQEYIDKGKVRVRDVALVKKYIKRGDKTTVKLYNRLCELIAETGALVIPFKDLPEVKDILEQK